MIRHIKRQSSPCYRAFLLHAVVICLLELCSVVDTKFSGKYAASILGLKSLYVQTFNLMFFLTVHHELTIYYLPTWCTDHYSFIKYYSPLHVSSLKCSSSGGYSCTHAAYGTVTLYESSWWPVGTQLEWELTGGERLLVGREWQYHMLHVYNCILLKMSTWGSKQVEEKSILWINNNQCIMLVFNIQSVPGGMWNTSGECSLS